MKKYNYFKGSRGEALQDSFVLSILEGKKEGWYLEIGSAHPKLRNNTFLLENSFYWRGISIDYDPDFVNKFNRIRRNPCILADATKLDYFSFLQNNGFPVVIDYLQLDIDPASNTLLALKQIPLDKFQFSVITFEHDLYSASENLAIKSEAAEILLRHGYVRVVNNLKVVPGPRSDGNWSAYEDWWIHQNISTNYSFGTFENEPWASIFDIPLFLRMTNLFDRVKKKFLFITYYPLKNRIKHLVFKSLFS